MLAVDAIANSTAKLHIVLLVSLTQNSEKLSGEQRQSSWAYSQIVVRTRNGDIFT